MRKFVQTPGHGFSNNPQGGRTLNFPSFRLRVDRDFNIVGRFSSSVLAEDCILDSSYSTEVDDDFDDDSHFGAEDIVSFASSAGLVDCFPIRLDHLIAYHLTGFGKEVFISYHRCNNVVTLQRIPLSVTVGLK